MLFSAWAARPSAASSRSLFVPCPTSRQSSPNTWYFKVLCILKTFSNLFPQVHTPDAELDYLYFLSQLRLFRSLCDGRYLAAEKIMTKHMPFQTLMSCIVHKGLPHEMRARFVELLVSVCVCVCVCVVCMCVCVYVCVNDI